MIGAIIGDIVGSVYEDGRIKNKKYVEVPHRDARITDDSLLTMAVMEHFITGEDVIDLFHRYTLDNRTAGWGWNFFQWCLKGDRRPYESWGNGAAMRISPCAYVSEDIDECLEAARKVTEVTHNSEQGFRAAEAITLAIWMARNGSSKEEIKEEMQCYYELDTTLDEIRPNYKWDVSCDGSVPQAIQAFLESTSYKDAILNAISLGGDADTMACIAGGIAEAFYGEIDIDLDLTEYVPENYMEVVEAFYDYYGLTVNLSNVAV
jgi:ADP-ribosylglycohydrolase